MPRPAYVVDFCPVPSWRCRSSSWLRMSPSDCTISDDVTPTPVTFISASHHLEQRVDHVSHCREHARVCAVGGLQLHQIGHFLVDVHIRLVGKPLLQRIHHDLLPLIEA